MKRSVALLIVLILTATSSFAAAPAVDKFTGGIKDVLTSPMEIHKNVKAETDGKGFLPFKVVGGFFKGGFYMGKQIATGTIHVATSPLELMKK